MAPEIARPGSSGTSEASMDVGSGRKIYPANDILPVRPPTPMVTEGKWHTDRFRAIVQAHPEIKALFGKCPWTAAVAVAHFVVHSGAAVALHSAPWWAVVGAAYVFGAWMAFNLMCLAHEGIHFLVFKDELPNRILAAFAYLPCAVGPAGLHFWQTHVFHHTAVVDFCEHWGSPRLLAALPGPLPFVAKLLKICAYPVITTVMLPFIAGISVVEWIGHALLSAAGVITSPYVTRGPVFRDWPGEVTWLWVASYFASLAYHATIVYLGGWRSFAYLMLSFIFFYGPHPLAARTIQEHYWVRPDQPTNSIYTPYGWLTCHLNLHVEHHDFPNIPCWRLPKVREIAPEFYDNLFSYRSYTEVMYRYLTDLDPSKPFFVHYDMAVQLEQHGKAKTS